jgi:glycosyltransferase involved in cell wall biosynthesis
MVHQPLLVSIVTPFLNAERFLDEAVASVLAQTYAHWELLLVDDGSSDRSAQIAAGWVRSRPDRICYLEHEDHRNQGTSASRNLGIRNSHGDYLAFLDADDVWRPGHLSGQLALLERHPEVGLVYGPTEEWYSWTGQPEDRTRDHVPDLHVPTGRPLAPPGPLPAFVRREVPSPCTCSVLVRRSVVDAIGGFEPAFCGMYDDQAFYAKACLTAPVLAAPDCSSRYRRRPDSLYSTAKATGQHRLDRLAFLRWLDHYLAERGGGDPELDESLRREFWVARHPTLSGLLGGLRRWT